MDEISIGEITITRYFMLYIEEYELAAMADFHIGYEDVMASQGLFLPKIQKRYILDILDKIYSKYAPKVFVVGGDLKHEFSRNMPQEWSEIEEIIDYLTDRSELIVIRGNHDNFLKSILKKRGIELRKEFKIGKYVFVHGHEDYKWNGTLIMGHEHPSVTLRDDIFATLKLPCFLYSPDLIVLPAVSIYASGTDITKNDFISPIIKNNPRDFEIFAIEEKMGLIPVGKLSSLLTR